MNRIAAEDLEGFAAALFEAAGVRSTDAAQVAESLVAADLRGHNTHGTFRVPWYIDGFKEMDWIDPRGDPEIVAESPVTAVVDANRIFGQVAGRVAVDTAIEKARESGVGIVGVRDATHLGRIGEWAERAADAGCLSMFQVATQGGSTTVGPAGSADRIWSTNPMTWGVPTFGALEFPIVLDMATSQVAHGKIRTRAKAGEPIPEGWTTDEHGEPATDAVAFEDEAEGALLPLGGRTAGYKGFGMALMSELFSGIIGDGFVSGQQDLPRSQNIGAMHVIDPTCFTESAAIVDRVAALTDLIRSADYSDDIPVGVGAKEGRGLLPGEPEHRYYVDRVENGIPLEAETREALRERAIEYGIEDEIPY